MNPSNPSPADSSQPIFLHTLFRSGGTYVWSQFRRDPQCTAYYEPFNELLALYQREAYAKQYEEIKTLMRHTDVKQEYFAEYPVDASGKIVGFHDAFAYTTFALTAQDTQVPLKAYMDHLLRHAPGRPVIKFCRSLLRLDWLTENFSPLNVGVVRNPRDQWQSFNAFQPGYFHAVHLLMTARLAQDRRMQPLTRAVHLPAFTGRTLRETIEFYQLLARHLDKRTLYRVFYHWWCLALLEFLPRMDLIIDVDEARTCPDLQRQIHRLGLVLDLAGCRPRTYDTYDLDTGALDQIEAEVEAQLAQALPDACRSAYEALPRQAGLNQGQARTRLHRLRQATRSSAKCACDERAPEAELPVRVDPILTAYAGGVAELLVRVAELVEHIDKLEIDRKNATEYIATLETERKKATAYINSLREHLDHAQQAQQKIARKSDC